MATETNTQAQELAAENAAATAAETESATKSSEEMKASTIETKKKPAKKQKQKTLERGNAIAGLLFVLPFIFGFIVFLLYPLAQSLWMSFCEVTPSPNGLVYKFLGFSKSSNYYRMLFVDDKYSTFLWDEVKHMLFFVPGILVFSFFIALLLNQEFKGRTFVRAVYFLPVILASGVMLGVESSNSLLNGIKDLIKEDNSATSITTTLESILLQGETASKFFQYIIDIVGQVYDVAISSGIQIVIFLSGLQTISPSMYEAAKIEGCTSWESFWKITFPMIGSMILVNVVYTFVDFFTKNNSNLMNYIQTTLLNKFDYGMTSAMSWVYFLIIAAFLGIVFAIGSRTVYYYD